MRKTAATIRAVDLLTEHLEKVIVTRSLTSTPAPAEPEVARLSLGYLAAYGYLEKELEQWNDISLEDIQSAIRDFQEWIGLRASGQLDSATYRTMLAPRCGCPDVPRAWRSPASRKWGKRSLTYRIENRLPCFDELGYAQAVQAAFDVWCSYADMRISVAAPGDAVDILVGIGRGKEFDFDGTGNTLAWAQMPTGDDSQLICRFDADETWSLSPNGRAILLGAVASHEFGHLLGLPHSQNSSDLMSPLYSPLIVAPTENDITALRTLYGEQPPQNDTKVPEVKITIAHDDIRVWVNGKLIE